jgi:hypothetical protein
MYQNGTYIFKIVKFLQVFLGMNRILILQDLWLI